MIAADAGAAFATDAGAVAAGSLLYLAAGDGESTVAVDAATAGAGVPVGIAADGFLDDTAKDLHGLAIDAVAAVAAAAALAFAALCGSDGAAEDGELAVVVDAAAAGRLAFAAGGFLDGGLIGDVQGAVAADAAAAFGAAVAALGVLDEGLAGDVQGAVAVDAVAAVIFAVAALRVFDGAAGDVQGAVAVDAVAGVKVAFAALRFFDGAALNRDGNIPATVAAADAVAGAATHGLLDGAARDGDIGISAVVTAADAGTIVAALGFYGAAGDVDGGSAEGVCAAADACAALLGLRLDFGTAGDGDIGVAGSFATAANAGTIGGTDGCDVAACYLNVAGATVAIVAGVPDAADASRGTAACGSQAAGVVAILICFGCDGQFAGGSAAIALFVVLKAGMFAVAGEGIVALERDRRVARALDAEGGVVVGLNVDILQRHVEGAVFDLVDDFDDVVGDVFGCVPEVFRRGLQGRGRFVPGLIVVIGVGDIEGWAGVRELASQHRAVAGLGLFREISLVFLAAGGVAGLVLVFLAAGGAAGLVLVFLAAALGVAEVDHVIVFAVF